MKIILCILVSIVSSTASDSSHSDSSSHEWEEIDDNYEIAECYDENVNQYYYNDDWEQDYEEESWGLPDFSFISGRISLSCFLHGDYGCETKCNLQCTLYDCQPRTSCCDDYFHCNCDEVYEFGSDQLTQNDFEFLEFNDLWGKTFQSSLFEANIRKLIRNDKKFETYILSLLRNPHVSGDDIISILNDKRPGWSDLFFLKSNQHFVKTKLIGAGKPLQYKDLNDHIDELQELMKVKPIDDVAKVKHRRRVKKFLQNITNIDDLEELLHLIKLSGNKNLYQLAKSLLKNLGYGFEEDGEKAGAKGLLSDIAGELTDADEDEIMDIVTSNKFMTQSSTIIDEGKKGQPYQAGEISTTTNKQPVTTVGNLQYEQNAVSAPPLSLVSANNAPGLNGQIMPAMPILGSESASYFPQVSATENGIMSAFTGNIQNAMSTFSNIGQAIPSSGIQKSDSGHKLYYIVVDEHGKVTQANMASRMPFMVPVSTPISPSPQRIGSSQDTAMSNNSQAGTSSWYSLPPYPFGSVSSIQLPSFPMGIPTPYMWGPPNQYPFVPHPPNAHEAPPPSPPKIQAGGGNGGGGGGYWSSFSYSNNNNNNNNK